MLSEKFMDNPDVNNNLRKQTLTYLKVIIAPSNELNGDSKLEQERYFLALQKCLEDHSIKKKLDLPNEYMQFIANKIQKSKSLSHQQLLHRKA